MSRRTPPVVEHRDAELVFGLVAPLGVDRESFVTRLQDELRSFGYDSDVVRLSNFLKRLEPGDGSWQLVESPEAARIDSYQTAGDLLRADADRHDMLALMAAAEVAGKRAGEAPLLRRRVHILVSLKHPDEVHALREIYGEGFFLIGLYTPESERLRFLVENRSIPELDAQRLMKRDDEEPEDHGQQARDAFQLSDVFIRIDRAPEMSEGVSRFLDLVFGKPSLSPTADEHAMFLAYAASLRSAALGRQVGAVVLSQDSDVLAVGANDVPRFGGGQYWPGPDDERDHRRGHDSNATQKEEIIQDVADRLARAGVLVAGDEGLQEKTRRAIRESRLFDITEYGREVHAEMEALLSCARSGGRARGGTLFTTTFPCHNCAKHVVGAGIHRVVFVEPYPKSKAFELHADALTLESSEAEKKVFLEPFVGIGPRRYLDLFSLKLGGGSPLDRKSGRMAAAWRREAARPRVPLQPMSYIDREKTAAKHVEEFLRKRSHQGGKPQ